MHKRKIQGDHGSEGLGLVEYNLVVPLPVRCKLGGEVAKQFGEIAELKEYSRDSETILRKLSNVIPMSEADT